VELNGFSADTQLLVAQEEALALGNTLRNMKMIR